MKEITRIHLAATPYNIELAAKKELEEYLGGIERVLAADEEALREIEARMIELLSERGVKGEQVITAADVAALKERLGAPGEFADEPLAMTVSSEKRLMRDEKNAMVGGVLAGAAAYTGVDVVWWRVAAIVLGLLSFGSVVLVYAVLWIAIPPARTAADRLQLRGERASLENIQAESSNDQPEVPTHKKPFVVILRLFIGLGLLGVLFGSLALVVVALVTGMPLLSMNDWTTNGWVMTALVLGMVSGVLLAALMAVGIYMVAAWRAPKSLVWLAGVIIVAGLATFATAGGMAIYGGQQMQRTIDEHTVTRREDLPELRGVSSLSIARSNTSVSYQTTTGAPYAEVTSFQRDTSMKLPITVTLEEETARLVVGDIAQQECSGWIIDECTIEHASVTVYGPALDALEVDGMGVNYEAKKQQRELIISARDDATVTLDGRFDTVTARMNRSALYATDAAIQTAKLVTDSSDIELGVVRELAVESPQSCASERPSRVAYDQAGHVTLNGKDVAETTETFCIEFERSDDQE